MLLWLLDFVWLLADFVDFAFGLACSCLLVWLLLMLCLVLYCYCFWFVLLGLLTGLQLFCLLIRVVV